MAKINSVDDYIQAHKNFSKGLLLLRSIIEKTELVETIKWNSPIYTVGFPKNRTVNNSNLLTLNSNCHNEKQQI